MLLLVPSAFVTMVMLFVTQGTIASPTTFRPGDEANLGAGAFGLRPFQPELKALRQGRHLM